MTKDQMAKEAKESQIKYIKTEELIPYVNNPRTNDQAVDSVAASIKEFGFKQPIVIDKDKVVVAGHTRLKASKKLGLEEVPCIIADDLTEEQIKAYRLADNKVAESADWDLQKLELELKALEDVDMSQFGFEEMEEEAESFVELEEVETPDEVPERVSPGEIWKLGEHRLMCGDSTKKEDVEKLRGGQEIDLVFTDPPYGMKKESDGVLNDNLNYDDLLAFNKKWIPLTFDVMKKNGSWYCWGTDEPLMDIYSEILKPLKKLKGEDKLTFRNLITWDKGSGMGQLSSDFRMYPIADEKCLFVMRGRQTYGETEADYWEGFEPIRTTLIKLLKTDLNMSTDDIIRYAETTTCSHWFAKSQWEFPNHERFIKCITNMMSDGVLTREEYDRIREEYDRIREEWYNTRAYFNNTHDNMNNVWHFDRTTPSEKKDTGGHATPKPIALCSRAIKSSSREGEIVLDVFGGSGSTLIACEQLNRKCYMMELDPHYCDVIIQRWENFTGRKAERIEG